MEDNSNEKILQEKSRRERREREGGLVINNLQETLEQLGSNDKGRQEDDSKLWKEMSIEETQSNSI